MPAIALIANPGSGSSDPDEVERHLRAAGAEVERFGLEHAERAAGSGLGRVAVAGGDGSVGPAAAAAAAAGVPLAVIPAGTANDFARRMGLSQDLEEACRLAVDGERLRVLELGRMDGRPFVNVASLGLPAPAAERASSSTWWLFLPAPVCACFDWRTACAAAGSASNRGLSTLGAGGSRSMLRPARPTTWTERWSARAPQRSRSTPEASSS